MKVTTDMGRAAMSDLKAHIAVCDNHGYCEVEEKLWRRVEWFSEYWSQDVPLDTLKLVNSVEMCDIGLAV